MYSLPVRSWTAGHSQPSCTPGAAAPIVHTTAWPGYKRRPARKALRHHLLCRRPCTSAPQQACMVGRACEAAPSLSSPACRYSCRYSCRGRNEPWRLAARLAAAAHTAVASAWLRGDCALLRGKHVVVRARGLPARAPGSWAALAGPQRGAGAHTALAGGAFCYGARSEVLVPGVRAQGALDAELADQKSAISGSLYRKYARRIQRELQRTRTHALFVTVFCS